MGRFCLILVHCVIALVRECLDSNNIQVTVVPEVLLLHTIL